MSRIVRLSYDEGAIKPTRGHADDAGMDLYTCEAVTLQGGEKKLVSTGVHFELPEFHFGLVTLRSGFASKNPVILANGVGIIDAGYRGPVKLCLQNIGTDCVEISKGSRIAQMVVIPCLVPDANDIETLSDSERGTGGFGSTDSK